MGSETALEIQAGYNIKEIQRIQERTVEKKPTYFWKVIFEKPIKDNYYAACVSVDMSGVSGQEMVGVYAHAMDSFKFDCYPNAEKVEAIPNDVNIIVR